MKTGAGWLAFERCGVAQRAFLILMVVFGFSAWGQTNVNYWTNATTGKWESSNSWSVGAPPNVSQAAVVSQFPINANVTIDAMTAQLAPQSLTVGGIELLPGNTLVFSNSIGGLPLQVTNQLSMPAGGLFDQQAGTTIFPFFDFGGGSCRLRTGNMFFGTVQIAQQTGGGAQFVQDAGTNHIGALNMGIGGSEYDLNGGVLFTGSTVVMAYREAGAFQQNGGTHAITNSLTIQGCAGHDCNGAYYILTNGTLSAQSLGIDDTGGWSTFSQKGGTTLISASVQAIGPAVARGILALDSGFLGCSDVVNINNGIADLDQSGGAFVVSNVLHFAGYTPGEQSPGFFIKPGFADFNFSGGTLWANNIEMSANFNIGSSTQAGRITNPGYFKLAGTINISDANEQLGTLILATDTATNIQSESTIVISNSLINFAGSNAVLAFARSDSQAWSNAALLVVSNWNGSLAGGGNEQLRFGQNFAGISAAQLSQIVFVNPAGVPAGTYAARILTTGEVVPTVPVTNTNSWISPFSGLWDNTNAWSLGIAPATDQSVWITNDTTKSVSITAEVASNAPGSLAVGELTLSGSNTLVLDNVGAEFDVVNQLTLNSGAAVSDVNSAMNIGGEFFLNGGANFYQNGGSVTSSGGASFSGNYYLSSGNANFPAVSQYGGSIEQYGGNALFSLRVEGGRYDLFDGTVSMFLDPFYTCNITQTGGTNYLLGGRSGTPGLHLGAFDVLDSTPRNFSVEGGHMFTDSITVNWAGNFGLSAGTVLVTNQIVIYGSGDSRGHPITYTFGNFGVGGGQLFAGGLQLNHLAGSYSQSGGTVSVAGDVQFVGGNDLMVAALSLSGGTLTCSNLEYAGGVVDIEQSGGNLMVSNLLAFDGYYTGYQFNNFVIPPRFVRYDFNAGTLNARNIELSAEWSIGSSTAVGRIANTGYFQTSGTLDIGQANEQLGRFILAGNAVINFTGGVTRVGFVDSHAESWSSGVFLSVSNWNGATNGGGTEQLIFGSNASGLTAAQVGQIRFVNPVGFAPGAYAAKILATGEVVPSAPTISERLVSNGLVMSWPDSSYALQFATNVLGPWTNVANASSPYTNSITNFPQEFFRLQR